MDDVGGAYVGLDIEKVLEKQLLQRSYRFGKALAAVF